MIKNLIKLADHLDKKGLHKEADYVDALLNKYAETPRGKENHVHEVNPDYHVLDNNKKINFTNMRIDKIEARISRIEEILKEDPDYKPKSRVIFEWASG